MPLSPLFFYLAIEPPAAAIQGAINFPGVTIGGMVHKLMLYADDILLLVSNPSRSVPCYLLYDYRLKILGLQYKLV